MLKVNVSAVFTVVVSKLIPPLRPWVWSRFAKILYPYISKIDQDGQITLMNYGYNYRSTEDVPALSPAHLTNRYSVQLYCKVASGADLRARKVLEVGSGRGGGAAAVKDIFEIRTMCGVELSEEAVDFCNDHYSQEGLSFTAGTAEKLPYAEDEFDAVLNVESSHCYRHIDRFFSETVRVLRPDGYFLYTDFREPGEWVDIRENMIDSGLDIISEEDITDRVVEALEKDNSRKLEVIDRVVPKSTKSFFRSFAAVEGMPMYKAFKNKEIEYRYFVAKPKQLKTGS